jgi:hypothetical protein
MLKARSRDFCHPGTVGVNAGEEEEEEEEGGGGEEEVIVFKGGLRGRGRE